MTPRLFPTAVLVLLLAGCATEPPPPDWQMDARAALDSAVQAQLTGNLRVAEADMARARSALGATGRPGLLARAELVLCAARVASLDLDGCAAYFALARDAGPADRAYAAYLFGNAGPDDVPLLPAPHHGVAMGRSTAISALPDPLARLVAAAVLLQQGRLDPAAVAVAVETASAYGWRRPLLAWLGVQLKMAEQAGDREGAGQIRRRMGVAGGR